MKSKTPPTGKSPDYDDWIKVPKKIRKPSSVAKLKKSAISNENATLLSNSLTVKNTYSNRFLLLNNDNEYEEEVQDSHVSSQILPQIDTIDKKNHISNFKSKSDFKSFTDLKSSKEKNKSNEDLPTLTLHKNKEVGYYKTQSTDCTQRKISIESKDIDKAGSNNSKKNLNNTNKSLNNKTNNTGQKKSNKINKDTNNKTQQNKKQNKDSSDTINNHNLKQSEDYSNKKFNKKEKICHEVQNKTQQSELRSWLKSKIGNKTYNKHRLRLQKLQNELVRDDKIRRTTLIKENKEIQQEITNTFFRNIYCWESFTNWVKFVLSNPSSYSSKRLTQQQVKFINRNYFEDLFDPSDNNNDIEVIDDTTDTKLIQLPPLNKNKRKKMSKPNNNQANDDHLWDNNTNYDQIEFLQKMAEEVRLEKQQLLIKSKHAIMERLRIEQLDHDNSEPWTVEGMKGHETERKAAFEDYSINYLPTRMPLFESVVETGSNTKFIIPMTVSIKLKKNGSGFKATRLLVAMVKLLQMSHPESYIATLNYKDDPRRIVHHNQVPLDYKELLHFMVEPSLSNNNIYSTKIIIHTNCELKDYLEDNKFRKYLTSSSIHVEYNTLDCLNPQNVGYLEEVTSSRDTVMLHEERLRKLLPSTAPSFQVNLVRIYGSGSDSKTTYLVMVQSKLEDVEHLCYLIEALDEASMIVFFPWSEYITITQDKKQTVVSNYRKLNYMYRSVVVSGFIDNDDNTPMWDTKNSNDNSEYKNTTTVSDYLRSKTHPITGLKMFDYVYPTVLGKREFMISVDNLGDSERYLKNVIGELAKLMCPSSIELEFSCPATVHQQMEKQSWKPFGRAHAIVGTKIEPKIITKQQNKRVRTSNDSVYSIQNDRTNVTPLQTSRTSSNKSYAQVVSPSPTSTQTTSSFSNTAFHATNNTITNTLQNQIDNLQLTVVQMQSDTKINNNVLLNDITSKMDTKINIMKTELSCQYKRDMEETGKKNTDEIRAMFKDLKITMGESQTINSNRMGAMERTSDHIMNRLLNNNSRPMEPFNGLKINESFMDEDYENDRNPNDKENYASMDREPDNEINKNSDMN
jgi:hypothetical protein